MSNEYEFKLKLDGEFSSFNEMTDYQKDMISDLSDKNQETFMYGKYSDLDNKVMIKLGE